MAVQISQYGAEVQRNIRILEEHRLQLTKWEKKFLASVRVKDPNYVKKGEWSKLKEIAREAPVRSSRLAVVTNP